MKNKYLVVFMVCTLFTQCISQESDLKKVNNEYKNIHLARFDRDFVSQFPNTITSSLNTMISAENTVRGFIGIILYEYQMDIDSLKNIETEIKRKAIQQYNSSDKCLLVINRFDTDESYKYPENIVLPDSISINKTCYKDLLPIPKFFRYTNEISNPIKEDGVDNPESETMLPVGFNIYVLEAKSGNYFDKYDLIPNRQMPDGWKNGYSKGVAISQKHRCVIYWSVAF